jgi:predicted phosphodiesterase
LAAPTLDPAIARQARDAVQVHGSQHKAARALGISRNTLVSRLRTAAMLEAKEERQELHEPLHSFEEAWQQWKRCIGMARDRYGEPRARNGSGAQKNRAARKILVVPDLHAPFHEPEMFAAMLEKEADADHCICIGDLGDSYALSRFTKYERMSYRDEWASVTLCMQEMASRFPKVTIVIGNHDARLEKQLRERLTEDMVDAISFITGGVLCPITAMAKRYPNVEIAKHQIPNGHAVDWCVEVGDAWLGHPEKFSVTPGAVLRKVEEWISDNEMAMGFNRYRLIVVGHTHQFAMIPWRSQQMLVECGAMCKTAGYMTSPRIGGRPQRRGYLTFNQVSGRTDLNSVKFTWFDVMEGAA